MTGKERFAKALRREKIEGHVPHFELVFFLTMEVLGKVHPSHRFYEQWNQMSQTEKKLQMEDMADCYIKIAEKYNHDAIFVHPNPSDLNNVKWLLETIREKTGNQYFLMMHGDTTCGIPDGESMMEFTAQMYEEPEKILETQKAWQQNAFKTANALSNTGLLDGFALCSDYSFNVNPFFSPDIFAELIAPNLKETLDTYRKLGFYSIKHTDGNINPILDQIVACGPDALHSIDPQGGMSLTEVRRKYGDRICTIGNVNCGLLQTGTDEEAAADVRRTLKEGMSNGDGFIFSTSNCVYTGLDLKRYEMMNQIWREEGIY
jgi:uroporphyrinogen decarboxylase